MSHVVSGRIHSVSDLEGRSLKRKVLVQPSGTDRITLSEERESYKFAVRVCRCACETFTHPRMSKFWGFRIITKSYDESMYICLCRMTWWN